MTNSQVLITCRANLPRWEADGLLDQSIWGKSIRAMLDEVQVVQQDRVMTSNEIAELGPSEIRPACPTDLLGVCGIELDVRIHIRNVDEVAAMSGTDTAPLALILLGPNVNEQQSRFNTREISDLLKDFGIATLRDRLIAPDLANSPWKRDAALPQVNDDDLPRIDVAAENQGYGNYWHWLRVFIHTTPRR